MNCNPPNPTIVAFHSLTVTLRVDLKRRFGILLL